MDNRQEFIDKLSKLSKEEMLERYIALLDSENLTQYVADLEAKLAESEKDRLMWQEMYKSADRQNKSICETDIYPLQEENQQLKDKLEIKLEELHIAYCGIENVKTKNGNLKAEVKQLKQQLAEKDEEIKQLKFQIAVDEGWAITYRTRLTELEDEVSELRFRERNINGLIEQLPNQNQTAIAELKKTRHYAKHIQGGLIDYIDQQIRVLKGETDGNTN